MNLQNGYFAIPHPGKILDRCLNPYRHRAAVSLHGHTLNIEWTNRADKVLSARTRPVVAEMQLYFTCVIKKRVLFHEHIDADTQEVNDKLRVAFQVVEAASCDPVEFAKNFSVKRQLHSTSARKFHPQRLLLDFHNGQWLGEFYI